MPLTRRRLQCAVLLLLLSASAARAADKWLAVDPADLASRTPQVDPNADAEAIFWDVRVSGESGQGLVSVATIFEHYLRVKIYTDRGRETQSQVQLRYRDDAAAHSRIQDIDARTIGPDGKIVELQTRDIFDRSIVEQNGLKMKAKAFALPAVVAGSIVEYRWKEVRENTASNFLPLSFQRDIPVRLVRYHIKPLALPGVEPHSQTFNVDATAIHTSNEKDGFTAIEIRNMAALTREPFMPPPESVEAWMVFYYRNRTPNDQTEAQYWTQVGKTRYGVLKPHMQPTDSMSKLATDATRSLSTPQEKIAALVTLARQRIKRIDVDTATAAERQGFKPNVDAADALRRGIGIGQDVTGLFVALATATGLDARLAMAPDRAISLGQPSLRQPNFLPHFLAAVKIGATWQFVDPANEHAKDGHTSWQQEGMLALLLDSDAPAFVPVPVAPPETSLRRRTGTMTLHADGVLEGDLRFEYTGHWADQFRERDDNLSPAEVEKFFRNDLAKQIPGSVVSDFHVEHLNETDQPYVIQLKVRAPGYAQASGNRLFVQPAVMVRGIDNAFSASTRRLPIHFPFAYTEEDNTTIELPAGYELEPGTPPAAFGINNNAVAHYVPAISAAPDTHQLHYTRTLMFGNNGRIFYPSADYASIKTFFDSVHTADNYTVALRTGAAAADTR